MCPKLKHKDDDTMLIFSKEMELLGQDIAKVAATMVQSLQPVVDDHNDVLRRIGEMFAPLLAAGDQIAAARDQIADAFDLVARQVRECQNQMQPALDAVAVHL